MPPTDDDFDHGHQHRFDDEVDQRATDRAMLDAIAEDFSGAPDLANPARGLLEEHFGADPLILHIASDNYIPIVSVHLQNAIERFVEEPGRRSKLHGLAIPMASVVEEVSLSKLISAPTLTWPGAALVSPDYVREEGSVGRRNVLRRGLYLVHDEQGPLAIWVAQGRVSRIVDVMAPTMARAQAVIDELRQASYHLNPFKGQCITITIDCPGNVNPVYLKRPHGVSADEVVLPPGLLDRIEKQAIGVGQAKDEMLRAGHSIKRGILIHGRPGTGKTHTIRYLISRMTEYTVIIIPAGRMELFTDRLAEIVPYVTPGIMVFDDVDLIAEDRSNWLTHSTRGPLFTLLELMDGINTDADLLFILTTNVAERLEEAIAARPGRVDQAFEIPLPDRDCRRRLFDLYAAQLTVRIDDMEAILDRTEGVTGSFLMELVRRAAVVATLEEDDDDDDDEYDYDAFDDDDEEDDEPYDLVITDAHVTEALDQLLDPDNDITALLLGAAPDDPKPSLGQLAASLQRR